MRRASSSFYLPHHECFTFQFEIDVCDGLFRGHGPGDPLCKGKAGSFHSFAFHASDNTHAATAIGVKIGISTHRQLKSSPGLARRTSGIVCTIGGLAYSNMWPSKMR